MPPLRYHEGQIAVQQEAKTTQIVERLAHWVGPIAEFAQIADLFLFAIPDLDKTLQFTVLSGKPPLMATRGGSDIRLQFPSARAPRITAPTVCGGLAIHLGQARRVRTNGRLIPVADGVELEAQETFTLCRKYMAPSLALDDKPHLGPVARESLAFDDPWLAGLLSRAETSFLASISPEGGPDVAHRGGPPGFIKLDATARRLTWIEYVGDGIFKSAGNIRATGGLTLLVPDHDGGDGVELIGRGEYTNQRTDRRVDPLVQHRDPFPIQGIMTCEISRAFRLRGLLHSRKRIEKALKITSRSTVDEQAPQ
ncbi:MAG: pyridoxamine 5'-phosphate oxidase family protein [Nitrospirae bacterium]|nr:pyridoxamine 5'-phosphate oxidase family protein [Nitrospirota bacterium]